MGFLFIFIVMVQTATPLITNRGSMCQHTLVREHAHQKHRVREYECTGEKKNILQSTTIKLLLCQPRSNYCCHDQIIEREIEFHFCGFELPRHSSNWTQTCGWIEIFYYQLGIKKKISSLICSIFHSPYRIYPDSINRSISFYETAFGTDESEKWKKNLTPYLGLRFVVQKKWRCRSKLYDFNFAGGWYQLDWNSLVGFFWSTILTNTFIWKNSNFSSRIKIISEKNSFPAMNIPPKLEDSFSIPQDTDSFI